MQLGEAAAKSRRIRTFLPTLVVLAICLALASLFAWMTHIDAMQRAETVFKLDARTARDAIVAVMRTYSQSLRAGAGMVEAASPISRRDWSIFVRALALPENVPGSQGLGHVRIVKPGEADSLIAEQKRQGFSSFVLNPPGERPLVTAIVYLEPLNWRNERALGYDMFSEPVRRAAMERSRDTGEPALSRRVTLVQETEDDIQAGTLLYMPFYLGRSQPRTLEERRDRIGGWIYSAFRMRDFFEQALPRQAPGAISRLRLEVFDADTADPNALLYDTQATTDRTSAPTVDHSTRVFRETLVLDIAGTQWTLRASSLPALEAQSGSQEPWAILAIGIACSFLLAGISGMLDYSRNRYAAAESRLRAEVEERKRAEDEARLANRELIHRVKNTLAIVTAIASQTGRHASTIEDFNRAFRSRLAGLARVQDLLGPNVAHASDLGSFARELLAPYIGNRREALATEGPEVKVGHSDATLLSLVLNELATNATKYGAWSAPTGKVVLTWAITGQEDQATLELIWQERGGPPVAAPNAPGFGSSVTRVAIERGLRGQLKTDYDVAGVRHTIHVPRYSLSAALPEATTDMRR